MHISKLIRAGVLAMAGMLSLVGCSEKTEEVAFHSIDITGADYANDFSLPDQNGQLRKLADFQGKVVVVFFGYTQCPDVCPTSLAELAQARKLLGADGDRLQGIFVSVDPERDTPALMKEYLASFDPTFLALNAQPEALPEVAKQFKIYYKKVPGSTPDSYTMDHSAGSYIYDPQGHVRLYFRYGGGAQAMADDVKLLLAGK